MKSDLLYQSIIVFHKMVRARPRKADPVSRFDLVYLPKQLRLIPGTLVKHVQQLNWQG